MEEPDDFSGQFPRINEYVRPSVKGRMMKMPLEILAKNFKTYQKYTKKSQFKVLPMLVILLFRFEFSCRNSG